MEKITFEISNDGSLKIETSGYKGSACLKELEKFRAFMKSEYGIEMSTTNMKKKPEFYEKPIAEKTGSRVI
jgi:hypothetical protein